MAAFGPFELHEKIGTGRFGSVYRATDAAGQVVALKIIAEPLGSDPAFAARLQQEARAAAKIRHPNLAAVFAAGEQDGQLSMTLEYLAGGSLAGRLARARDQGENGLPLAEVVRLLEEMTAGLAELHRRQIVHGDLSPAKFLLDAEGHVHLSGWALAASLDPDRLGIPAYRSPEQEQNAAYLRQSADVYSLGVILYEMLTLRSFKREAPGTPLNTFRPDAPGWLLRLLEQMLEKDPEHRPWDGDKILQALRTAQQSPRLDSNQMNGAPVKRGELPAWPEEIAKQAELQQDRALIEPVVAPPPSPASQPPPPPPLTPPTPPPAARPSQPPGRKGGLSPILLIGLVVLAGLTLAFLLRRPPAQGPEALQVPAPTEPVAVAPQPTATWTQAPAPTEVPPAPTPDRPTATRTPRTPTRVPPSPTATEAADQINFWNGNSLYQVNQDGSNLKQVIDNAGRECLKIAWNQKREYAYSCDTSSLISIRDDQNREIRTVRSDRFIDFSLAWSADGTEFLNSGLGCS